MQVSAGKQTEHYSQHQDCQAVPALSLHAAVCSALQQGQAGRQLAGPHTPDLQDRMLAGVQHRLHLQRAMPYRQATPSICLQEGMQDSACWPPGATRPGLHCASALPASS